MNDKRRRKKQIQEACKHRNYLKSGVWRCSIRGRHYICNCGAEIIINHMTGGMIVIILPFDW